MLSASSNGKEGCTLPRVRNLAPAEISQCSLSWELSRMRSAPMHLITSLLSASFPLGDLKCAQRVLNASANSQGRQGAFAGLCGRHATRVRF